MNPGDRLRKFIAIAYGGSQVKCADALAISPQSLSQYVNAKREFGKKMLKRFEAIGLSPAYVVYGQGDMFADNVTGEKIRVIYKVNKDDVDEYIVADTNVEYVVNPSNNEGRLIKENIALEKEVSDLKAKVEVLMDVILKLKSEN